MSKLLRRQGGFTLIELIIVMVIIGILAVLLLPNLSSGPKRARDSQRKSDLRSVQTALEQYFADNQSYPNATDYNSLSTPLTPNFIKSLPSDPKAGSSYTYAGSGCTTNCTGYTMTATLEYPSTSTYTVTNSQ